MRETVSSAPRFLARALCCAALFLLAPVTCLAQPAPQVFCGAGLPDQDRLQQQQRAALGYLLVCEENLRRFDRLPAAQPLAVATAHLAFTPVVLDETPFRDFELVGSLSDVQVGDAGASALHRFFRTPARRVIDLREWDMSVTGGEVFSRRELQTEQVNGAPAQLVVLQAPSGRAFSVISWMEGRRHYELSIDTNVLVTPASPTLQQLAASLPKSVAAKPGEGADCPLAGEKVQWVADYCMASLETDDQTAAEPCIQEENRARYASACVAKQHYKRELCKLLIDSGSVQGPLERCANDPAFRGHMVERGGATR